MRTFAKNTCIFLVLACGLSVAGCASEPLPNGQKPVWSSFMLPNPPKDGYMSSGLETRDLDNRAPIAEAIARHEKICAETGCPEWKAHIAHMKKITAGQSPSGVAWLVHDGQFSQLSWRSARSRLQYGKEYFASPAEFFAAGKTGDAKALSLAEFMTFKELGWNTDDVRYTVVMIGKYYVPTVMVRSAEWDGGTEHMLYNTDDHNSYPDFYKTAALIYSTNGTKLWEQKWSRNGEYALPGSSPTSISLSGDRTTASLFY